MIKVSSQSIFRAISRNTTKKLKMRVMIKAEKFIQVIILKQIKIEERQVE